MERQIQYDITADWKFLKYHNITWVRPKDVEPYIEKGLRAAYKKYEARQIKYDPTADWKFLEYHDITWVRLSDVKPYIEKGLQEAYKKHVAALRSQSKPVKHQLKRTKLGK